MAAKSKDELTLMEALAGVDLAFRQKVNILAKEMGLTWNHFHVLTTPAGDKIIREMLELLKERSAGNGLQKPASKPAVPGPARLLEIDTDPEPKFGPGSKVIRHVKLGKVTWTKENLFLKPRLEGDETSVIAHELFAQTEGYPVFNINVFNALAKNPDRIGIYEGVKRMLFMGTAIRDIKSGHIFVRSLHLEGSVWKSDWFNLNNSVGRECVAPTLELK